MKASRAWLVGVMGVALCAVGGCGGDDEETESCDVEAQTGCNEELVCAEVVGEEQPACFQPVKVRGRVFDAISDEGVDGATVVALDPNGSARSSVVVTDADGAYDIQVPVLRAPDGTPAGDDDMTKVTLRVAASGYQPFPKSPRTALPIDLTQATSADDTDEEEAADTAAFRVDNAATDVALIPLEDVTADAATIGGTLMGDDVGGVLIVASQGDGAVATAVTDADGSFTLFNVPAGSTSLTGYRAGIHVASQSIEVEAEDDVDVELTASSEGLATVSGSVNIVDAPGGAQTSVILVPEATFDAEAIRGEAPAGLRAGEVTSAFEIPGVPPGTYFVLAAFENDELVRDPDEGIAGTDIVSIEVDGEDVTLEESFKVTEALDVVGPGADGLEVVTDAMPTLEWADDSSEDGYELRVFDAFGEMVFEDTEVPRVTGSETVTYAWDEAELEAGMIYQFRVVSFREPTNTQERTYISATEDLEGVFQYDPDA